MKEIVIMRHGESVWNLENRFTGWVDVELSKLGRTEAKNAGVELKKRNIAFDFVFTSTLTRAIHTANIVLSSIKQRNLPMIKEWRLNERHYGALQGLNKSDMAKKYGEEQVLIWRRSFDVLPPPLTDKDYNDFLSNSKFFDVPREMLPRSESLKEVIDRVIPFWTEAIMTVARTKKVLVVAHGNSLRAVLKFLENISEKDIVNLNIPTGVPILLKFDDNMNYIGREFIGDAKKIQEAISKVQKQGHTHQ